jgi:hypothetical protein
MSLSLSSVDAKLARAREHRDALERELYSWYDSIPGPHVVAIVTVIADVGPAAGAAAAYAQRNDILNALPPSS